MSIPYFEVLAFTDRLYAGNPAGVCLLESKWLPDEQMQAIAAENNLAETAFVIERENYFDLRWFTPAIEMDLCGHATLASAHVIFNHLGRKNDSVSFQSKSGELRVDKIDKRLVLDFPSQPASECEPPEKLAESLRARPTVILKGRDYFAVFDREEEVAAIAPDFDDLGAGRGAGRVRDRAGKRLRFCFALFRAARRDSGRSGHRIDALRVDSVLVGPPGQTPVARPAVIETRRGTILRRSRRSRGNRRKRRDLSGRENLRGLKMLPVAPSKSMGLPGLLRPGRALK